MSRRAFAIPKRIEGWKFRRRGEFAHYFRACTRADCYACDAAGQTHALCDRSILVGWTEQGGFAEDPPLYRSCPDCRSLFGK